jgi:hypothetical protein
MADLGRMCHLHARNEAGGLQMTLYIDTKPTLEWIEYNGRYMADGYEVRFEASNGKWYWMYYDQCEDHAYYEDPYHAKAAAQADYEARTAERFRKVELPDIMHEDAIDAVAEHYYNQALRDIHDAIAKAKIDQ